MTPVATTGLQLHPHTVGPVMFFSVDQSAILSKSSCVHLDSPGQGRLVTELTPLSVADRPAGLSCLTVNNTFGSCVLAAAPRQPSSGQARDQWRLTNTALLGDLHCELLDSHWTSASPHRVACQETDRPCTHAWACYPCLPQADGPGEADLSKGAGL